MILYVEGRPGKARREMAKLIQTTLQGSGFQVARYEATPAESTPDVPAGPMGVAIVECRDVTTGAD